MRSVGIFQAKNQLSDLVAQVEAGAEITLTRHGKPVAVISAVTPAIPKPADTLEKDANGWPLGFFERTFGSIPDLERWPQGEVEEREPLE